MKKILILIPVLAVGVVIGILGHQRSVARDRAAAVGTLRLHGNVDLRDAQLAFFGQERIATVLVEEGDRVEPDQLLATLHRERLEATIGAAEARIRGQQAAVDRLQAGTRPEEIRAARAAVAAAEVRLANDQRAIVRVEATSASGASSAKELDDARATLEVATAELEVQRAALDLALAGPRVEDRLQAAATLDGLRAELAGLERQRADTELHAPAKGVIRTRILEPGEMASPERPVFTLSLTDPKWVRAYLPEPDLGRVKSGMRATIRSDSFGGRSYEGWVGFVSSVAEFTPKAVETEELRTLLVYEVRVFVRDPNDELPLGIPVTVDLEVGEGSAPAQGSGR